MRRTAVILSTLITTGVLENGHQCDPGATLEKDVQMIFGRVLHKFTQPREVVLDAHIRLVNEQRHGKSTDA